MDTVHELTDRRTDGGTDRITITDTVQTASHGKNLTSFILCLPSQLLQILFDPSYQYYNNNNNNLIYIAPACRMTSETMTPVSILSSVPFNQTHTEPPDKLGRVKLLISSTYSYGGATALRARVTHLPVMEHGVLMVKVVMKSVVIIYIQHI